jgi:cardiolipin synthase
VTTTTQSGCANGTPTGDRSARVRRTLEGVIGVPATEGNQIDVLRNGREIFPAMLDAIGNAQHTIDLLTFVYWEGDVGTEFANALAERARAGVRVRVLLDAVGAQSMERSLCTMMEDAGVQVRWFRPLHRARLGRVNHRTHRKVLIADEAIAFTGGVGIADEWRGDARDESEWRDTHFRIRGPAVDGLRAAFLDNWTETDQVLFEAGIDRFPDQPKPGTAIAQCVRGVAHGGHSDIDLLFRSLLQVATRRVRIATAYFVPGDEIVEHICAARERGVEVEILLPGPHADKRFVQLAGEADYGVLLDAGVQVWSFQPSMLHLKMMTVDGIVSNIGSANLNSRSMALDEEINIAVIDAALTATLDAHFDEDLARSVRIQPVRWSRRSFGQQLAERLMAPVRRDL